MAMPEGYDGMRTGDESERTDNPDEYKRTCIDFIEDMVETNISVISTGPERSQTIDKNNYLDSI